MGLELHLYLTQGPSCGAGWGRVGLEFWYSQNFDGSPSNKSHWNISIDIWWTFSAMFSLGQCESHALRWRRIMQMCRPAAEPPEVVRSFRWGSKITIFGGRVVFQLIPPRNDSLHQQGAAKRHLCVSESGGSPEHFLWRQSLRRTRSNQW